MQMQIRPKRTGALMKGSGDAALQVAPGTDRSPLWSDFNLAVREVSQQLHDSRLNVPYTVKELSSRQNNKLVSRTPAASLHPR